MTFVSFVRLFCSFQVSCDAALANLRAAGGANGASLFRFLYQHHQSSLSSFFPGDRYASSKFSTFFCSFQWPHAQKISTFIREENERRIVNGSNYPNTSHDITYSDILSESRIEKSERSLQFCRYLVIFWVNLELPRTNKECCSKRNKSAKSTQGTPHSAHTIQRARVNLSRVWIEIVYVCILNRIIDLLYILFISLLSLSLSGSLCLAKYYSASISANLSLYSQECIWQFHFWVKDLLQIAHMQ